MGPSLWHTRSLKPSLWVEQGCRHQARVSAQAGWGGWCAWITWYGERASTWWGGKGVYMGEGQERAGRRR